MNESSSWYVYIVQCADRSLYTGVTTDLLRRVDEHNSRPRGARYTRARRPVRLVYFESSDSRACACKREHALKRLSPASKRQLINVAARDCQQVLQGIYPDTSLLSALED
ncbi:GIY-YIG nuclease family protein [Sulfuriflexus sp.]|uniref:GIY-YIG nuclease family protein n=1 Tax=Sulfuriflexus sp. TaxID=2015443 RepID=UPI0028CC1F8B|nr:GIY-YIG nuclease family protein [Sulfuriflexus sp.]MDT8405089.1 GIY-YIG nuclease family protein [Sulfuriflexus sp.]